MNMRFVITGVLLGAIVVAAFLMGSPMFGGIDSVR